MGLAGVVVGAWWPLPVGAAGLLVVAAVWLGRRGPVFPDAELVRESALWAGVLDSLPVALGALIACLLMLSLMEISAVRSVETSQRARDYLVVVDTSRSMRQNTALLRADRPVSYPRRAGPFAGEVENPETIPELARYELARESLQDFLAARREQDRVGLIYFDSVVDIMTGFTANIDAVEWQLARMDDHVEGGTNIRWALEQGLDLIGRYPGTNRRAVILLTDAEARHTGDLQHQLNRMRRMGVSFYLLWITTDTPDDASPATRAFMKSARAVGTVYVVDDLTEGYLDQALEEIAELEDYAYTEVRHQRVALSAHFSAAARWLILVWALLLGTVYLPLRQLVFLHGERG